MHAEIKKKLNMVNYAGIAVVTLLLAGTTTFGVLPLFAQGHANIKKAEKCRYELGKFEGLKETLGRVEAERKATEERLKEIENRLPSSLEASKFNAELTEVAKAAGVRIESMPKPEGLKESGGYKALPVSIVGSGDWESCYRFLTGIKAMNRLTRLDSVALESTEKERKNTQDHLTCQITLKFSTFFMER